MPPPYSAMPAGPGARSRLHVVPRHQGPALLAFHSQENNRYYPVRALTEPIQPRLAPQLLLSYTPLATLPLP